MPEPTRRASTSCSVTDELARSLLALHGLHPLTAEQRIARALAECRGQLGISDTDVVLDEPPRRRRDLHVGVALGGGAMSGRVAEGAIRRAIEAAAPEVTTVEITGVVTREAPLVQLRVRREAG